MTQAEFDKSFAQAREIVTICSLEHSRGTKSVDCDSCPLEGTCLEFWDEYATDYKSKMPVAEYRHNLAWNLRNLWTLKHKIFKYRKALHELIV